LASKEPQGRCSRAKPPFPSFLPAAGRDDVLAVSPLTVPGHQIFCAFLPISDDGPVVVRIKEVPLLFESAQHDEPVGVFALIQGVDGLCQFLIFERSPFFLRQS